MRILFIHTYYRQRGGEDHAVETEAALLKARGHVAEILVFENKSMDNLFEKFKSGVSSIYNIQSYNKTVQAIKSFKPDVIHIHNLFFDASPSVLFAAKKNRIPVVATIHNYRLLCANALLMREGKICELCIQNKFPVNGIKHKCYHNSYFASALVTAFAGVHKLLNTWNSKIDMFITLSSFAKNKLLYSSLQPASSKITVKVNFCVDYGEGLSRRSNFFLFAGRIAEEKGIRHLLKAFDLIGEQIVITGDGPLLYELKKTYQLNKNIVFKGTLPHNEIIDLMKICKAVILPSIWYEGLPFIILEAFSAGTPVLTSKIGAMSTAITDGYNGFHFEPGSYEQIINAVKRFNLFEEKEVLYKNARHTFLENYTENAHYSSIMNIYEHVCKQVRDKT